MAWLYSSAASEVAGGIESVQVLLNNPVLSLVKELWYYQQPGETTPQFEARVQADLADKLNVLNITQNRRGDATNRFRPHGPAKPTG